MKHIQFTPKPTIYLSYLWVLYHVVLLPSVTVAMNDHLSSSDHQGKNRGVDSLLNSDDNDDS